MPNSWSNELVTQLRTIADHVAVTESLGREILLQKGYSAKQIELIMRATYQHTHTLLPENHISYRTLVTTGHFVVPSDIERYK